MIKIAAVGDAVMASTIVTAAQARWPGAELTWVAGTAVAELAALLHGVHRVVRVDDAALFRGNAWARSRALLAAWRDIGRGYDVALVAHTDARYRLLAAVSGAREIRHHPAPDGKAAGERWHGASYASMVSESAGADARLAPLDEGRLPAVVDEMEGKPVVVIAPGGARNTLRDNPLRRWPIDAWCALTAALTTAGVRVVIVGAKGDVAEAAACEAAGGENRCGETSIAELIALIRNADCVVSHDSGVLHLAILAETRCVALFGPTRAAHFVAPGAAVTVLSAADGLACAPCYDGRNYAPCQSNRCLRDVPVQGVVEAVLGVLTAKKESV